MSFHRRYISNQFLVLFYRLHLDYENACILQFFLGFCGGLLSSNSPYSLLDNAHLKARFTRVQSRCANAVCPLDEITAGPPIFQPCVRDGGSAKDGEQDRSGGPTDLPAGEDALKRA